MNEMKTCTFGRILEGLSIIYGILCQSRNTSIANLYRQTNDPSVLIPSFYSVLIKSSSVIDFPWKMVWQSKVPTRVVFFSWTAALGKILTTDKLWKRHIAVLEWCFMCKRCGESVDHVLLHCPTTYELWSMVFCLFGIYWVMPYKVSEVLASW